MAIEAILHENYVHYMTTLTVVNAIIAVGNSIAASVSGGGGGGNSGETFKKTLEELKNALIPGEKSRLEEKTKRIKRILKEEASKGPLKIKAMGRTKKKKGSMKRK